jgi:hypothetical protein
VIDSHWSDEARRAMTDHILTCEKRPEKELCDKLDASQKKIAALVEALAAAVPEDEDAWIEGSDVGSWCFFCRMTAQAAPLAPLC